MKYYLISDTHFNHKKLIEWGRPEDFELKILKGLEMPTMKDIFIHLGDICIGKDEEAHNFMFARMGVAKYILVKGNHDNKSNSWYYDHGWDFVCERFDMVYKGKKIVFTHAPVQIQEDEYNIHGHTHGNDHRLHEYYPFYTDRHIDICPDIKGYNPLNLDNLIK